MFTKLRGRTLRNVPKNKLLDINIWGYEVIFESTEYTDIVDKLSI